MEIVNLWGKKRNSKLLLEKYKKYIIEREKDKCLERKRKKM